MNSIKLVKPVVLTVFACDGLKDDQRAIVRLLHDNSLYVKMTDDGLVFENELEDGAYYGAEAIITYLNSIEVKLQGVIYEIDVEKILSLAGDLTEALDLLFFIMRIDQVNQRIENLMELDAPATFLQNEARMLNDSVDALWFNWDDQKRSDGTTRKCLMTI